MSRVPSLSSPFLIGFDQIERALDRVAKAADGYPPYNIERLAPDAKNPARLTAQLRRNALRGVNSDVMDRSFGNSTSKSTDGGPAESALPGYWVTVNSYPVGSRWI